MRRSSNSSTPMKTIILKQFFQTPVWAALEFIDIALGVFEVMMKKT